MGLGLAIAQRAVRAHGGEISVSNLPGEGCVFTIEVPLAFGEPAPAATATVDSPDARRRDSAPSPF